MLAKWGYVDTVMSNVGIPFFGPFEEVHLEHAPRAVAEKIAAVVLADNPRLFNQVDTMSSVFFFLNQHLPTKLRDAILLSHMRIRD